ncbi:MAG: hypothetical protein ABSF09_01890 [Candidatus Bathyarchaeia archaeon]
MKVAIDDSLLAEETLFCGGGTRNRLLELRTKDILALTNAIVGAISERNQETNPHK